MQMAIVEFARNVAGFKDANSAELNPDTMHPVIYLMPEQNGVENIGGTLRLGAYPCVLKEGTKAYELYGAKEISERHRHRYEVNNDYRSALEEHGMTGASGIEIQTKPCPSAVPRIRKSSRRVWKRKKKQIGRKM